MSTADEPVSDHATDVDPEALTVVLRRFVRSRLGPGDDADDIVQEALARVLASRRRIAPGMTEAYAITTARNLLTNAWRENDRFRRHRHRLVESNPDPIQPDTLLSDVEDRGAVADALSTLSDDDRTLLVAHEVEGRSTRDLAQQWESTPAAIASRLHRIRARLRVEYLIQHEREPVPSDRCRAVLLAFSMRDRRRQREYRADSHVLDCPFCARLWRQLGQPGEASATLVAVTAAPDVVTARQTARDVAAALDFPEVELTVIATAVSEMARNMLRFAGAGEILISRVEETHRRGVRVIARDHGPGILDVDAALRDGYSTIQGLGIGLPGIRRLADEFDLSTRPGDGTTVTFIKWQPGGRRP